MALAFVGIVVSSAVLLVCLVAVAERATRSRREIWTPSRPHADDGKY